MLYLIKEDMWIAKLIEVVILEIEIDDLVVMDTLLLKPVTINLHNGGFSATANAGYHFDKRLVFESNQLIEIFRSFYSFHIISLLFDYIFAAKILFF